VVLEPGGPNRAAPEVIAKEGLERPPFSVTQTRIRHVRGLADEANDADFAEMLPNSRGIKIDVALRGDRPIPGAHRDHGRTQRREGAEELVLRVEQEGSDVVGHALNLDRPV